VIGTSFGLAISQAQRKEFPRDGVKQRRYQFLVRLLSALPGVQQNLFDLAVEIGGGDLVNRRRNQRQSRPSTGTFIFRIGHVSLNDNGLLLGPRSQHVQG